MCHVTNQKLCINSLAPSVRTILQSILIHSKSDMMGTRSSHPLIPPAGASEVSNNQEMMDFMRHMAEFMKVLKKQNKDLNTRPIATEAQNSRKEIEREERHEKERWDKVRRGKRSFALDQQDNESTVQGSRHTV